MAPAIRHGVYRCRVCRGIHPLRSCQRFLQLPAVKRLRAVLINKYCANCLAHEHSGRSCRSKARCRICREAHHTLLHIRGEQPGSSRPQRKREPQAAPQPQRRQEVGSTGSRRSASPMDRSPPHSSLSTPTGAPSLVRTSVSILPTAAVLIGSEQKRFDVRVLVDPCCPVSRIHVSLVKALNLAVTGVGNERIPSWDGFFRDAVLCPKCASIPLARGGECSCRTAESGIPPAEHRCWRNVSEMGHEAVILCEKTT
ncbi:uncharacterized protein LOC120457641 isoform X2 [Drosophila santomea]|uniref:uncharacterized protein LOC120457641 isoform X2 n=2 Tax=Drosophila santomea TaxID=129105 RepID=UPI001952D362|nr:uncharacterized protein LOC120457641 isoform X2 [Drosophila santomea]